MQLPKNTRTKSIGITPEGEASLRALSAMMMQSSEVLQSLFEKAQEEYEKIPESSEEREAAHARCKTIAVLSGGCENASMILAMLIDYEHAGVLLHAPELEGQGLTFAEPQTETPA
jgi:hypothetical protein